MSTDTQVDDHRNEQRRRRLHVTALTAWDLKRTRSQTSDDARARLMVLKSRERLRALDVQHLLPGHGRPVSGDVWGRAIGFGIEPPGRGLLPRCSRRFGVWPG